MMAAVYIGGQFVQQIALVGDALRPQVPEMVMRVADGELRLQSRLLG